MRPLGIAGIVLILIGLVVLALGGISYTKERESVQVGPLGVTAERKGFVPPVVGILVIAAGAVLVFVGRRTP